jgi:N-formylglutamate deformylase
MHDLWSGRSVSLADDEVIEVREQETPLVLSLPHSGTLVPPEARQHVIASRRLLLSTDLHSEKLYAGIMDIASSVRTRISPNVVNVNRGFVFQPDEIIARFTEGSTVVRKPYSKKETQILVQKYYRPYHQHVRSLIRRAQRNFGYCLLIDGHSMSRIGGVDTFDVGETRPHFNIGDNFGKSAAPAVKNALMATLKRQGAARHWKVSLNVPYMGGEITQRYGQPQKNVHVLQIETRKDLYMRYVLTTEGLDNRKALSLKPRILGTAHDALIKAVVAALRAVITLQGDR